MTVIKIQTVSLRRFLLLWSSRVGFREIWVSVTDCSVMLCSVMPFLYGAVCW